MKLPTTNEEMEAIYDRYVRSLESQHWGKFVAVSLDGRVLLGDDREAVAKEAFCQFGSGNFVMMRVGLKVVGKIRKPEKEATLKWRFIGASCATVSLSLKVG